MQEADELKRMELEAKKELYLKKKEQSEKEKQAKESGDSKQEKVLHRFEVNLGAKELWQFSMYHSMSGMKGVFNLLFTLAALYVLIVRFDVLTAAYKLLLVGCILIFTVWQPLLLYWKARKQAKLPAISQPMILSFGEQGFKVEQNGQQAEFTWEQIGRMDGFSSMIVIYMDRVHAYLLPNFAMNGEREAFCQTARTYLKPNQRKKI